MDEVVASVQRVTDIMAEISSAGDEQSAGIEQINQAVSEMDTVTQQNAALVEEAAAAAEAMQNQAANLERVVSVFRVDGGAASAAYAAAPAARCAAPALQPNIESGRALAGGGQPVVEAVPVQHLAHEQQADALAAFLGGEEGREQLVRRHLAQQVAAVDHR
jgi:methyl-accepting chemotaxis protein